MEIEVPFVQFILNRISSLNLSPLISLYEGFSKLNTKGDIEAAIYTKENEGSLLLVMLKERIYIHVVRFGGVGGT
ncbi:hypothetical protein LguiB_018815 [Lonicera macranthoides]